MTGLVAAWNHFISGESTLLYMVEGSKLHIPNSEAEIR